MSNELDSVSASGAPRSAIWRRLSEQWRKKAGDGKSHDDYFDGQSVALRACADELEAALQAPDLRELQQAADFLRTEGFGGWANDVESAIHHLGAVLRACAEAPEPRGVMISATEAEVEFLAVAAGLRAQSVEEYVKRAINAALRKQGVDAVLFRESDDE